MAIYTTRNTRIRGCESEQNLPQSRPENNIINVTMAKVPQNLDTTWA
jgi:hypothetical protein